MVATFYVVLLIIMASAGMHYVWIIFCNFAMPWKESTRILAALEQVWNQI